MPLDARLTSAFAPPALPPRPAPQPVRAGAGVALPGDPARAGVALPGDPARAVCGFVLHDLVRRYGRAALMVHADNAPAIAAYERLGMTRRLLNVAYLPTG
ncbi:hypothetical protein [Kitasatospora sp. HPMI-4]|uniref:hypothetical protein n=1 Tax=Kitasatospora sp. HPMI-4 TaxID=3448443 RepID=UPI003F1944BC